MTPKALKDKLDRTVKQRNVFAGLMALSMVCTALTCVVAIGKSSSVILVPSTVDEYTISKGRAPDNYLMDMTRDVASLFLNRHPHDTKYFELNILRKVEPSAHDSMRAKIAQDEIENKYKAGERNWRPSEICVLRTTDKSIVTEVVGILDTYVNDRKVETRNIVQRYYWKLKGTRLYLTDIRSYERNESECLRVKGT